MGKRTKAKETVEDIALHVQELLGKLKLVDNFDWSSLEGRPYESTRTKWAKDTPSQGVIKSVEHVEGRQIVAYGENDTALFTIGGDSEWKWSYKDRIVSVSMARTARLPQELGPVPYTERIKYRIYLDE